MSEEKTITIKKADLWKYSTFLLIAVLLVGIFFVGFPERSTERQVTQQPQQPTGQEPRAGQPVQIDLSELENAPSIGDSNAPVTILEFYDYACGFCNRHHQETHPLLKQNYVDKGIVRIISLDFISVGNAKINSASKCVRELGGDDAFWKMHDEVYDAIHVRGERPPSDESFRQLAVKSGVDGNAFVECLNSGKYNQEISQNSALGRDLGVSGTPGFLIGNEENEFVLVSGAQPYNVFQQVIESNL